MAKCLNFRVLPHEAMCGFKLAALTREDPVDEKTQDVDLKRWHPQVQRVVLVAIHQSSSRATNLLMNSPMVAQSLLCLLLLLQATFETP